MLKFTVTVTGEISHLIPESREKRF